MAEFSSVCLEPGAPPEIQRLARTIFNIALGESWLALEYGLRSLEGANPAASAFTRQLRAKMQETSHSFLDLSSLEDEERVADATSSARMSLYRALGILMEAPPHMSEAEARAPSAGQSR